MREFIDDYFEPILAAFLVVAIFGFIGGCVILDEHMQDKKCARYEATTGNKTQRSWFDECYVQRDGRWWRWDEYKLAYATTAK